MTAGYGARVHVNNGQVEVTMSVVIDGAEHYVQCPVGDGFYFAQRALEMAVELARKGGLGKTLAQQVLGDNLNHGGLLTTETLNLATVVAQKG